ncbi:hypothetical protein O181_115104 [Austropuccinia psidii MF-1]|uniref:Uncharacterized protein n=1 Tax=Austropuccinia psidii MF-1 TaxID=1389203 RepID=A0A9Q3PVA3_9BASI|nr:hypothetical protein [Austropuccinia psidii MF-1]
MPPVYLRNLGIQRNQPEDREGLFRTRRPGRGHLGEGKGRRHSVGLITERKWTPIATQRNRKPQTSASTQGKPILTTCTGKITIINPVVSSKGKFPKAVDSKLVQGKVKGE